MFFSFDCSVLDSQNSATCFFPANYKNNKFEANRKCLQIIISCSFLQDHNFLGLPIQLFFCAWKAPGSCSRTWNRAHVFRAWFRVHVFRACLRAHVFRACLRAYIFRACLRAHVFRAWPVANALKRHTFQTEIKSILYCNDQRFD